jgi:cellulose synthase/poly-beta-1,6-N-acetylglucosamine synthase-like glycosyltransferase
MNPLQVTLAVTFWISLGAVAYAYIGYPIVLWLTARLCGKRSQPPATADESLPFVSLLIVAYNEESVIEERVRNALAMDYPENRREIVIASDGSTDATAEIVRRHADRGVRLLDNRERRGKAMVLNAAFPELRGEIVLLSDANTNYDLDAARRLVRWFGDPTVGVVCGRLILTDPLTGRNADSLYWKYETFLKRCEGRLGALLGVNGAIYAIRRELVEPIPTGVLVDDFVLPLLTKMRTGCAMVYDKEAVAREETPADISVEFNRRSRIGAGGFQSIGLLWRLLNPARGWVAFTFFSHKILRWSCPFFLIAMFAANLALCDVPPYGLLIGAQVGFYALSLLAALLPPRLPLLKPLRLTTMFTSMNAALLMGFWRWLRAGQDGTWKRTLRTADAAGTAR